MKIHLINFLCYTDSTFDFGKEGLTLISGSSGAGKSSILKGIFFALFGEGNKVQHYGKTSCSVELEFEDSLDRGETLKILRTKRPNHLVINDVYEDAAAQEIINKRFGVTFKTSGYIQQNNLSSFILMSPIDKLGFLEQFSFQDVDLGKIKGRCKRVISETHDELLSTRVQLDMSTKILSEIELGEEVIFPITSSKGGKLSEKNREIAIKNENVKYKNNMTKISRLITDKQIYQDKLVELKLLLTLFDSKKESISHIDSKLEKISRDELGISYIGDEAIELLWKKLQQIINQKELVQLELLYKDNMEKLRSMELVEMETYKKQLDILSENLWKEYDKSEIQTTLEDLKICLRDCENIKNLQSRIEKINITQDIITSEKDTLEKYKYELDKLNKLAKQNKHYNCPECKAKLHLIDEQLILSDVYVEDMSKDEIIDKIAENTEIISTLEKSIILNEQNLSLKLRLVQEIQSIKSQYEEIPEISSLNEDIIYLQEYRATQVINEKKCKEIQNYIDNKIFSNSYKNFQKETEKLYDKLQYLSSSSIMETNYDEDELRNTIFEQKQHKTTLKNLYTTREELNKEKTLYLKTIQEKKQEFIEKFGIQSEYNFDNIRDETETTLLKLTEKNNILESANIVYKNNIELIDKWQNWYNEKKKYDEWSEKCSKLKVKEKEDMNKYSAAMTLKNKILQAESIAIGNIIETINMHSREYLECFFPDYPISVQLQAFKENKKTAAKPCINIMIEYKGMECDINMLSGGELARVVLAYTLALSEIFNTPILLLDECTASLDQELTNVVFDGIRENFKGKLVLIIAHQIIMGTFDKIITL